MKSTVKWTFGLFLIVAAFGLQRTVQQGKELAKEVAPLFKEIKEPKEVVDPDYTSDILGIKTEAQKPVAPALPSTAPSRGPAAISQQKSPVLEKPAPTQSNTFSGAPFVPAAEQKPQPLLDVKPTIKPDSKQQSTKPASNGRQVEIQDLAQYFGGVEEYDATSEVLKIKKNRFEKKPFVPKKSKAQVPKTTEILPTPKIQDNIQPIATKSEPIKPAVQTPAKRKIPSTSKLAPKRTPQSSATKTDNTKPATPTPKPSPSNSQAAPTTHTQSTISKQSLRLPANTEKQVSIVSSVQYFGKIEKDYDVTSEILKIQSQRFAKKATPTTPSTTSPQHQTANKPQQTQKPAERQQLAPKPRPSRPPSTSGLKKQPKLQPTVTIEPTQKPIPNEPLPPKTPIRPTPSHKLPDVIDISKPVPPTKEEPTPEELEGSKTFILKVCSIVIVGIAIIKLIQWRKSHKQSQFYEDKQQHEGEFSGLGQDTQLQLDPENQNIEESET